MGINELFSVSARLGKQDTHGNHGPSTHILNALDTSKMTLTGKYTVSHTNKHELVVCVYHTSTNRYYTMHMKHESNVKNEWIIY